MSWLKNFLAERAAQKASQILRQRAFEKVQPLYEGVNIYDSPEEFLDGFQRQPQWRGDAFAAYFLQSEVSNGGFGQLFYNSTGILAPEAVEAYERIGLPAVAELISKAMAQLGPEYPRARIDRISRLAELDELDMEDAVAIIHADRWDDLDNEFSALDRKLDIESMIATYVIENAGDF